jgi:mannosyl-glycoprotein endo-beta-N-acetylglucosaminidase
LKNNKVGAISCFLILVLVLALFPNQGGLVYASEVNGGIALNDPTHIYSDTSTSSTIMKSYSAGSILKYKPYSAEWYSATVIINGQRKNGYIHKSHVEDISNNQDQLTGIGIQNQTTVYAKASASSQKLKSYSSGSVLKYRTFSENWFVATVMIKGKATKGYIHKSSVESILDARDTMRGIGIANPTTIYSKASTDSSQLKTYSQGSILKYQTFSDNWYIAKVYVNGKSTTGYISKNDVESIVGNQEELRGIGLQYLTSVYSSPSTSSKKLRSYAEGTILKYKTFSSSWYEAVIYINGNPTTGYIHTSHVEGAFDTSHALEGVALKSPTNVYSKASKNASVLRKYNKGHYLLFRTFSPNWYEATLIMGGKRVTGYIHQEDVSTDRVITKTTQYNTDFKAAVDIQMGRAPQVSGKSGGWVNASRPQVEYYINSSNFNINSADYYQFLVLSQPAALQVTEVNQKILNDHGTLTGKAKAFIDAGKSYDVNEAYLISHALLETGNGRSALAQGVPVDSKGKVVAPKDAVFTVYNMYGIGAVDSCPLDCGAKKAFDEGWFTPEDAIIGGAGFINTYIARGQDTLYKMRWNPINPGHPQYATDVAWALKQTSNIKRIYDLLDRYVLIYDVPKYVNQPAKSGDPDYYDGGTPNPGTTIDYPGEVYGLTETPNNLNLREAPSTSSKVLGSIPNGSKIEILGTNGTWNKVKYDGQTGWVHGDYVTLLNLLEVSTGSLTLAIRPEPITTNTPISRVNNGTLLAGTLDKNNKLIRSNEWYQISYNGKQAWVSGGENGTEYIKTRN